MNTQGNLFGQDAYGGFAPSRTTDPQTSKDAAQRHAESGKLTGHAAIVLTLVKANPGSTYRELFSFASDDEQAELREAVEVMRRLNSLERVGLVRKGPTRACTVTGNAMTTWGAA